MLKELVQWCFSGHLCGGWCVCVRACVRACFHHQWLGLQSVDRGIKKERVSEWVSDNDSVRAGTERVSTISRVVESMNEWDLLTVIDAIVSGLGRVGGFNQRFSKQSRLTSRKRTTGMSVSLLWSNTWVFRTIDWLNDWHAEINLPC